MDEARLIEKLRRIEALHAGATTDGERDAAGNAAKRIKERLAAAVNRDPAIEMRFGVSDPWARRALIALLRRYGIEPYRMRGQHRTTVMAKIPRRFLDETFWPEFEAINASLHEFLEEVTERVISEAINGDRSEPAEVSAAPQLARKNQ